MALDLKAEPNGFMLPVSFAQERLWFLEQFDALGELYHVPLVLRLEGLLDREALRAALAGVVARHEVLRTGFRSAEGRPMQVVAIEVEVPWAFEDLRGLTPPAQERRVRELAVVNGRERFDLERPPLLRVRLVRVGEHEHLLLVCFHHIITDGWSTAVFVRDLSALYRASVDGEAGPPELAVQYGDFTVWQRARLAGESLAGLVEFWRRELAGAPELLALPGDRQRPAVQRYRGRRHRLAVPDSLTEELRRLGRQHGATMFMTLLAGFGVLLARWSGQDDVVVGVPVAGRSRSEFDDLIGFFVNTLPLRVRMRDNPSFGIHLARVREACLSAFVHQELPFQQLVEHLQPQRSLSHNPIFQTLLVFQNAPETPTRIGDLSVTRVQVVENATAKFDLSLYLTEVEERLEALFEYNSDLFDHETIERLAGQFLTLLAAAVADPETPVRKLPLLGEREHAELLSATHGPTALPVTHSLVELFQRQVDATPNAPAIVAAGATCSYAELDARANLIADSLRAEGAALEAVVGVAVERGVDFVATLLAANKLGSAFLPIDMSLPLARLQFILFESGCRVVVARASTAEELRACHDGLTIIDIEALGGGHASRPKVIVGGRRLAYVLYTSGSTGAPKGAMVEHDGMLNHMLAKLGDIGVTSADAVAQTGPQTFDIVVWQCLAPLLVGARIVVIDDRTTLDPSALARAIRENGVTVLQLVPALLDALNRVDPEDLNLSVLRVVVPTGEALPATVARAWLEQHPTIQLLNTYGLTECSDDQCHITIASPGDIGETPIASIGRPIANLQTYVLDDELELTPIGVPGQIYIGGLGVGRGYIARPDLTAERFVPDPFGPPGARAYRTGDVARFRRDLSLEFLGRVDDQVKIRGYRVEPGEVAARLRALPAVREAAVVAREEASGQTRLIAYLVGAGEHPSESDVRSSIGELLPEYMLPAAFVWLERLPLTPNGKLDRLALPVPSPERADLKGDFAPPTTRVEEVLASIWAEVLALERVGVDDNFFELGGDSILSILVLSRAAQRGLNVTLRQLFEHQTIAAIARVATEAAVGQVDGNVTAGLSPLTPIQH